MTSSLVINFGEDLIKDPSTKYWVFFSSLPNPSNNFGHTNAILVRDIDLEEISGFLEGKSSKSFIFDYTNNTQGGRRPNTPVDITVIVISLVNSKYLKGFAVLKEDTITNVFLSEF